MGSAARAGVTQEALLKALTDVRGGQRVTDENPEDKYQALAKYGRDLTAAARSPKTLSSRPWPPSAARSA